METDNVKFGRVLPQRSTNSNLFIRIKIKVGDRNLYITRAYSSDVKSIIALSARFVRCSSSPLRKSNYEGVEERRIEDLNGLYSHIKDKNYLILVAKDEDNNVWGDIIVKLDNREVFSNVSEAWIFDLTVDSELWGSRLAEELLRVAEDYVFKLGIEHIGLTVTVANERAFKFYKKMGYIEERVQMLKVL